MGFFSGLFGAKAAKKASKKLEAKLNTLYKDNKYSPYNVSGPLASTSMTNGGIGVSMSPEAQQSFDQFNSLINKTGGAANRLDQRGLAMEFFDQMDGMASRREGREFNSLESKVFNTRGVNTGSTQTVADFRTTLEDARQQRQFQATQAAQGFTTNLFNQFLGLVGGRDAFAGNLMDPVRLGTQVGTNRQQGNLAAANLSAEGAKIRAGVKAQAGASFGSLIDDAVKFGVGFI